MPKSFLRHIAIWWLTEMGSLDFVLPMATPPIVITFGSKRITAIQKAKTGFALNLIGIIIVSIITYYFGALIFDLVEGVNLEWDK